MDQNNGDTISLEDELMSIMELSSGRMVYTYSLARAPEEMSVPRDLFTPRLVSLGPYHQGTRDLQAMERIKKRYVARFFICRGASTDEVIAGVREIEQNLWNLYPQVSQELSSHEFLRMMLIDGVFLTEFLLRLYFEEWGDVDHMSQNRWTLLTLDILLLENQLPKLLLEVIFYKAQLGIRYPDLSVKNLIQNFVAQSELWLNNKDAMKQVLQQSETESIHILGYMSVCMEFPREGQRATVSRKSPSLPTIWELHRAGVEFRQTQGVYFQITFKNGCLEIPSLTIDENTERLFANLLAYEISNEKIHSVSDYVAMMDFLIEGPEDMAVLVKYGIVKNALKDDEAAANVFNNLGRNIAIHNEFKYSDLIQELNTYCTSSTAKWHAEFFEWKRDLKQNYIGNPWKLLSVVGALILLVLTGIQTVCSILQVT